MKKTQNQTNRLTAAHRRKFAELLVSAGDHRPVPNDVKAHDANPTPQRPDSNSQEHQIRMLGVPDINARVRTITRAVTLIKQATKHRKDVRNFIDPDLWDAIHHAAIDAYEEVYWLSQLDEALRSTLAPNDDQRRDIELIQGEA